MAFGSQWVNVVCVNGCIALSTATSFAQSAEEWREPPADVPAAPEPMEPARELRGAELKQAMPDLELRELPPPLNLGLGLYAIIPFQVVGIGVRLEAFPIESLRLEALYSAGLGWRDDPVFSNYAEASLGFRVIGARSERRVDVLREPKAESVGRPWGTPSPTEDVELRVWLPSYHALFVEGGMLTGLAVLNRCTANCDNALESDDVLQAADRQVLVPFAGLRYLYFVHAASDKRKDLTRKRLVQLYAHLLFATINEPAEDALWPDGRRVTRGALGARGGLEMPACSSGCLSGFIDGGYLPSPGSLLLSGGVRTRF